jgi:hypothetical protein
MLPHSVLPAPQSPILSKLAAIYRHTFCLLKIKLNLILLSVLLSPYNDLQSGFLTLWSWLRHYATSWKAPGSIRDKVISILDMSLGSTDHLTGMSTRNHPRG